MAEKRYKIKIDISFPEGMLTGLVSHGIGEFMKGAALLRKLDLDITKKPEETNVDESQEKTI